MDANSSDEEKPEFMQSRVGRQRWQGDEMELRREQPSSKEASAAVDLNQFRNYEVGKGYQAKHVVRQRGIASKSETAVQDMSKPTKKDSETRKRKAKPADETKKEKIQRFLECEGFRKFRKEIETIVTS